MQILIDNKEAMAKYDTPIVILPKTQTSILPCKGLGLKDTVENLNWNMHFHAFSKKDGITIGTMELTKV